MRQLGCTKSTFMYDLLLTKPTPAPAGQVFSGSLNDEERAAAGSGELAGANTIQESQVTSRIQLRAPGAFRPFREMQGAKWPHRGATTSGASLIGPLLNLWVLPWAVRAQGRGKELSFQRHRSGDRLIFPTPSS